MTITMMSKNGPYTTAATQARRATEKSVDVFKNGAKAFTDRLDVTKLPKVDLTESVTRYFDYLQMAVDFNRDMATHWAQLATTLSGSYREQAHQVTGIVKDQADKVADLTVKQAEKAEKAAKELAERTEKAAEELAENTEKAAEELAENSEKAAKELAENSEKAAKELADRAEEAQRKQALEAEEAKKAEAREAQRVQREEAKKAQQQAREAYEGLTKAELSDQLAGRGLPKTGNVDDLIERLVSADTK